jgi:hypothetical protein
MRESIGRETDHLGLYKLALCFTDVRIAVRQTCDLFCFYDATLYARPTMGQAFRGISARGNVFFHCLEGRK